MRAIVTGASGLLGRHLVAALNLQGWAVTSIVRTDPKPTERPTANLHVCDLSTEKLPANVLSGVDVLFHCAAAVADWATWSHFLADTVRSTELVCAAAASARCPRLIHISTVGVYGRPPRHTPVAEDHRHRAHGRWDYYRRSKIIAEQIVWRCREQLKVTVLRPTMMYGPGDRAFLGRVIPLLRDGKIMLVGDSATHLPLIHVRDVAAAAVLAATRPEATGEAFNVGNPEKVTQAEFFGTLASLIGAAPVKKRVPYALAYVAGFAGEVLALAQSAPEPPRLTRYRVMLVGYPRLYSTDKIREVLGWRPQVRFRDGIREAVQWQLDEQARRPAGVS